MAKQAFPTDNKEQTEVRVNALILGFVYGCSVVLMMSGLEFLFWLLLPILDKCVTRATEMLFNIPPRQP